jgi:hypothetical protein
MLALNLWPDEGSFARNPHKVRRLKLMARPNRKRRATVIGAIGSQWQCQADYSQASAYKSTVTYISQGTKQPFV